VKHAGDAPRSEGGAWSGLDWVGAAAPLALLLLAGVLQRSLHNGVESGLLWALPCGVWVGARAVWLAWRGASPDRDQRAIELAVGALGLLACGVYPVPPSLAPLLILGLAGLQARGGIRRGVGAAIAWERSSPAKAERAIVVAAFAIAAVSLLASVDTYDAFDEGVELVTASQIRDGAVPYRDMYTYRLPGFELSLAGWFTVWGESLLVARSLALIFCLLYLGALYRVGLNLLGRRARLALLVFAVAAIVPSYRTASHWGVSLPLVTGACALLTLKNGWRPRTRHALAGVAVGLGILVTWSVGILAAAAMSAALAVERERSAGQRVRGIALFLGCALVPGALTLAVIAGLGGAEGVYRDMIHGNATGYADFNLGVPFLHNGWNRFAQGLRGFAGSADPASLALALQVILLGVVVPLTAVLALLQGAYALARGAELTQLAVGGVGVAMFVSCFSLPGWGAVSRASPLVLAYALALASRSPRARTALRVAATALLAAGLALGGQQLAQAWRTRWAGTAVVTRRGHSVRLPNAEAARAFADLQQRVDALLEGVAQPRGLIVFYEPALHFHLDLPAWYRSPCYIPKYFLDEEEVAQRLRDDPPTLVLYSERYVRASYAWDDPRFTRRDPQDFFGSPVVQALEGFEPVGRFDALTFGHGTCTLYVPR